jgi:hypothetical protein
MEGCRKSGTWDSRLSSGHQDHNQQQQQQQSCNLAEDDDHHRSIGRMTTSATTTTFSGIGRGISTSSDSRLLEDEINEEVRVILRPKKPPRPKSEVHLDQAAKRKSKRYSAFGVSHGFQVAAGWVRIKKLHVGGVADQWHPTLKDGYAKICQRMHYRHYRRKIIVREKKGHSGHSAAGHMGYKSAANICIFLFSGGGCGGGSVLVAEESNIARDARHFFFMAQICFFLWPLLCLYISCPRGTCEIRHIQSTSDSLVSFMKLPRDQ